MDKETKNKKQREYRKRVSNSATHRYEKSPKGFLVRLYRNMQSRVEGVQKKKAHLYEGLEILDRESFYQWALSSAEFFSMFNTWVESGYDRKICPTVDRKESSNGYVFDNIRWLTHSNNSRLGAISKNNKRTLSTNP